MDLAARGLGVAVLSASMSVHYRDRLTALPIADAETPALLALVWRNTHSPAVRELLAHSRRTSAEPAPAETPPHHTRPTAAGDVVSPPPR